MHKAPIAINNKLIAPAGLIPRNVKLMPDANNTKPKMNKNRITLILLKKYFFAMIFAHVLNTY